MDSLTETEETNKAAAGSSAMCSLHDEPMKLRSKDVTTGILIGFPMTLVARLPQGINLATPKILKQTAGDTWNGPSSSNDS
jgi:hypothetical protein